MASDKDLQINVTTTADTSGLDKVIAKEKELGDVTVAQSSKIIDATGAQRASEEDLLALKLRLQSQADTFAGSSQLATAAIAKEGEAVEKTRMGYRVLSDEQRLANATSAASAASSEAYASRLEQVALRLSQVARQEVSKLTGFRAGGAQAAEAISGAVSGIGAEAASASGLALSTTIGITLVAAAGAAALGIRGLTKSYDEFTKSLEAAGKGADDFSKSLAETLTNAPSLEDATKAGTKALTDQVAAIQHRNFELTNAQYQNDRVQAGVNKLLGTDLAFSADAQNRRAELEFNGQLLEVYARQKATIADIAQFRRDTSNTTAKGYADEAKTNEDFRRSAFDALAPLQQQAILAQDIASRLEKAKNELLGFKVNTLGITPEGVAGIKTINDLQEYGNTLKGKGKELALAEAGGLLREQQALDAKNKEIAQSEADEAEIRSSATQKIADDEEKILALRRKGLEVSQEVSREAQIEAAQTATSAGHGKNAGIKPAKDNQLKNLLARERLSDKLTADERDLLKLLTDELVQQKEIEASLKRQSDAKDAQKKAAQDALLDGIDGRRKDLTEAEAEKARLSKAGPANGQDYSEAELQERRDAAQRVKDINTNPTDTNPFKTKGPGYEFNTGVNNSAPSASDRDNNFSDANLAAAATTVAQNVRTQLIESLGKYNESFVAGLADFAGLADSRIQDLEKRLKDISDSFKRNAINGQSGTTDAQTSFDTSQTGG